MLRDSYMSINRLWLKQQKDKYEEVYRSSIVGGSISVRRRKGRKETRSNTNRRTKGNHRQVRHKQGR